MAKKLKKNDGESEHGATPATETDYKDSQALSVLLRDTLRKVNRPLRMDELLRITHLPRKAKKRVENALYELQEQGRAVRASGGWAAPARTRHVEGVLAVLPSGIGFVSPKHGGADIYIHPANMNDAWHGDSVEALLLPGKRGPHVEGRVSRVLHRAQTELPAHALRRQKHGQWMCAPANPRLQALFIADVSKLDKPVAEGNLLLLRPGEKAGPNLWEAEATVNLEHEESPQAQERITKSNNAIPGPFPAEVLHALRDLPGDPREQDFADRRDARDVDFVTIDGRAARDFDDAIHVRALPGFARCELGGNGGQSPPVWEQTQKDGFRLRVAIADVSHYVRPDTPLDAEARQRGNSYYFPLSVEPMLPEALSNGLCSLKPDVPRLAVVADMRFSASGVRRNAEFYPAVIQSRARLTYGQVQRGLLLCEKEEAQNLAPVLPMLREAETLARALLERRQERGTLDFDLPEVAYLFNEQGELSGLAARERHFGHRMIEEFMIAANEAVAEFLQAREIPALYRVHQPPDPDKLAVLADFLARSGLDADQGKPGGRKGRSKTTLSGRDLRRILEQSRNTPGEYVITRLVLRSMMQARYQPENEGHFGLASECYCHFTSPIRRYADLVVHRALKRALGLPVPTGEKNLSQARLEAVAEHINATERTATEAEREIHKRLSLLFLRGREGESFDAVISGVTDFGLFVELPEFLCEGLVRLASLEDDYYDYVEERQEIRGRRTGRTFRLGRALRVTLTDVNPGRLELNFVLEGSVDAAPGKDGARTRRLRDGIRLAGGSPKAAPSSSDGKRRRSPNVRKKAGKTGGQRAKKR
ncbi:MAG: ribonuclease R [Desulfovibrionaceae bacterium]|nr:ribonuclease R [Desulfovibrionaceae bacterium]